MDIKFLIMDVDGTLTNGVIMMGEEGELCKGFHTKDGYGIKDILPQYGIEPVMMTARSSKILQNRCRELAISEIYQNVRDKKAKMIEMLEKHSVKKGKAYHIGNVAYIGDDIPDLQCMEAVKEAGGVIGCPADAVAEVKKIADFVSRKNGGYGAVRDFIEWLVAGRRV